MIYALQHRNPPQLFPIEFCKMLEQLLRRIILGGYFWKENKEEEGRALIVAVSGFHFFQGSYFLSHERMFFLHMAELFNLNYVMHFYIPKKGLSSPVFTIKNLVAEIFGCY